MARSRISNIAYGIFPPFLSSVSLNVDTAAAIETNISLYFTSGCRRLLGTRNAKRRREEEARKPQRMTRKLAFIGRGRHITLARRRHHCPATVHGDEKLTTLRCPQSSLETVSVGNEVFYGRRDG